MRHVELLCVGTGVYAKNDKRREEQQKKKKKRKEEWLVCYEVKWKKDWRNNNNRFVMKWVFVGDSIICEKMKNESIC